MSSQVDQTVVKTQKVWIYGVVFGLVLALSMLIHVPANWVLSHASIKNSLLEKGLIVEQVQGSIWNGSLQLIYQPKLAASTKDQELGKINWQFKPMPLLWLDGAIAMQWQYQDSAITADIDSSLLELKKVQVRELAGAVKISDAVPLLMNVLPPTMRRNMQLLQTANGDFKITQAQALIDLQLMQPVELQAQAQVIEFEFMGNRLPIIELDAEQAAGSSALEVSLLSKAQNWNLQGLFSSANWQDFSGELNLKAASSQDLPDWAFALRKKSDTHYFARF